MGAGEAEGAGCMAAYEGEVAEVGVPMIGLWGNDGECACGEAGYGDVG